MQWACDNSVKVHNCRGRDRQWLKGTEISCWDCFTSIRHLWSHKSDCHKDAQGHKIQRMGKSGFPSVKNNLGYSTGWHRFRNRDWEPCEEDFYSGCYSACSEILPVCTWSSVLGVLKSCWCKAQHDLLALVASAGSIGTAPLLWLLPLVLPLPSRGGIF